MANLPDRSGWLNGPLALYPPIPPFPDLTHFERRALAVLGELFVSASGRFAKQVEACRVVDRVDTKVGFYTRIAVDRTKTTALPISRKGGHFDVPGTQHGLSITLWDDDGYLSTIEGVTYGGDDLGGQSLVDLDFIGYQLANGN